MWAIFSVVANIEFGKRSVGHSNSCLAGVLEMEERPGTEASSVPVWARRPGVP